MGKLDVIRVIASFPSILRGKEVQEALQEPDLEHTGLLFSLKPPTVLLPGESDLCAALCSLGEHLGQKWNGNMESR
jgi:hypothetical protein